MSQTYNGRNARITVEPVSTEILVSEQGNWSLDLSADEIDTTAFGDGWKKSDVGMKGWTVQISGNYDPDDAGIQVFNAAFISGDLIDHFKLYVTYSEVVAEDLIYWAPASSDAGGRVTALKLGQDKSGVCTFSCTLSGTGVIEETIGVVPTP